MGPRSAAFLIAFVVSAAGDADAQQRHQTVSQEPLVDRFEGYDEGLWWKTDNRLGGTGVNDTGFAADHISIANGEMTLRLTAAPYRGRGHTGGSFKSRKVYGYGRFEAVMKAAKGSGVVSAFYTYTGPPYGTPHDEIDFEFLGRDPRLVHLNYFVAGEARLKRTVELPFDASEDFHLYAIEWRPGEIVWFVDGVEFLRVEGASGELPTHPGKIIADVWATKGVKKWAGELDAAALPASAALRCVSFRPQGSTAPTCADQHRAAENAR